MRLFIIEDIRLKEGKNHDDVIAAIKRVGFNSAKFVSYINTIDGRKDIVISINDNKESYEFRWFSINGKIVDGKRITIRERVMDWKYHGMGKVYPKKEIKVIENYIENQIEK